MLAGLAVSLGLVALTVSIGGAAGATPLLYVSQTGTLRALGATPGLGSSSQDVPISGLADVNEVALVTDGDAAGVPSDFYEARAELQTTLGVSPDVISSP
jgi:hypothetical protein